MLRMIWLCGFLEGEIQAAFAAAAGGIGEMGGQAGLAGARRAGDQDAAAAIVALPPSMASSRGDAGGNPLVGDLVLAAPAR